MAGYTGLRNSLLATKKCATNRDMPGCLRNVGRALHEVADMCEFPRPGTAAGDRATDPGRGDCYLLCEQCREEIDRASTTRDETALPFDGVLLRMLLEWLMKWLKG